MNKYPFIIVSAMIAGTIALAPVACGGGGTGGTGGGTGGGTSSSSSGASSSTGPSASSSTSSGGDELAACDAPANAASNGACYTPPSPPMPDGGVPEGGPDCTGTFTNPSACGLCVEQSCCTAIQACQAVTGCFACLTDPNATGCDDPAIMAALTGINDCANSFCDSECNGVACNPVTNEPCDTAAGEACDIAAAPKNFICYGPPNDVPLCGDCSADFCQGTMTCLSDGFCGRFCCDDGDCGTGKCDKTMIQGQTVVGICIK